MTHTEFNHLIHWLTERSGPIIRYLIACDLCDVPDAAHQQTLLKEVVATAEVQRWLALLGSGGIHGSKDACAENCLAKLCEFGVRAGTPELDAKVLPFIQQAVNPIDGQIMLPFLCWAGYWREEAVRTSAVARLAALARTASLPTFTPFLCEDELRGLPKAWHGKPIFRHEHNPVGGVLPLPWCYDLHLLAHYPREEAETAAHIDAVVSLLLHPEYQAAGRAYIWDQQRHTCNACGTFLLPGYRGFTAGVDFNPRQLIFTLEALARFPQVQHSTWFQACVSHLEQFRTAAGTYQFPKAYLEEREGYYLYGGMHMGLGENRRQKQALEIESTFRMLRIYRLAWMVEE